MSTCDEIKMNAEDAAITTWTKHAQQRGRHVEIVGKLDILKKMCRERKVQYINKPQATQTNDESNYYNPFFVDTVKKEYTVT